MAGVFEDKIGRLYCDAHRLAFCNTCAVDFEYMNKLTEQDAGITKKDTEVEWLAEDEANLRAGIAFMEQNNNTSSEMYTSQVDKLKDVMKKKKALSRKDLKEYTARYEKVRAQNISLRTTQAAAASQMMGMSGGTMGDNFMKAFAELTGNVTVGKPGEIVRDKMICSWCRKPGVHKLLMCSRCEQVFYCGKECQRKAWKGHKKLCVAPEKKKKEKVSLTWEQLEAFGGDAAIGKFIELKVISDESTSRQIMGCRDRNGIIKRIACYNAALSLPNFAVGKTFKWKNPRFVDGSSGCRIEEEDVTNIKIT